MIGVASKPEGGCCLLEIPPNQRPSSISHSRFPPTSNPHFSLAMPRKESTSGPISALAQQEQVSDGIENYELPKSLVTKIAKAAVCAATLPRVLVGIILTQIEWLDPRQCKITKRNNFVVGKGLNGLYKLLRYVFLAFHSAICSVLTPYIRISAAT